MQNLNVLIVEDHPIIANAYRLALESISQAKKYEFKIDVADSIDKAISIINSIDSGDQTLIFLDIKLEKSSDKKYLSGEDLGIEIRQVLPNAKIIVATTYNDNYRVNNILKSINPDGFFIKNDILPNELLSGIIEVIENPPYYSKTVQKLIRKHITSEIFLDKIDRQILFELSLGTKMKDLPNIIPMSMGGIERRKRQMKESFEIYDKEDKYLLEIARLKGFI